jgi:hypothetical protein
LWMTTCIFIVLPLRQFTIICYENCAILKLCSIFLSVKNIFLQVSFHVGKFCVKVVELMPFSKFEFCEKLAYWKSFLIKGVKRILTSILSILWLLWM